MSEIVWIDTCVWEDDERPLCSECEMEDCCLINQAGEASIRKTDGEKLAEEFGR